MRFMKDFFIFYTSYIITYTKWANSTYKNVNQPIIIKIYFHNHV